MRDAECVSSFRYVLRSKDISFDGFHRVRFHERDMFVCRGMVDDVRIVLRDDVENTLVIFDICDNRDNFCFR